ncbi:exodeoxyribonuclease V subunit gamma [Buchnera aphidicola]|uniref:exodeoxyribonuclease V subunit gamma n=1 Tax=Buchnera aphidicola TaxID=9 RepID=UPI002237B83E|nr:exodeoxyribonuclease V subunit gamma [Buchnera aphidicola]MCW5197537.1 exodeoxyribonuclease V subunit gamma [Buchnera aphidicola (Chaitophorus viminalis)]
MIKTYTSNNLNYLIKKICNFIKSNQNVFLKEIIIVENKTMITFIKNKISKILGIDSNISYISIRKFIFCILKKKIFNKKIFADQEYILWKLMNLSSKYTKYFSFNKTDSDLIKFKYFKKLSKILYEYSIHHPNWILNWNNQKSKIFKKNYILYKIQKKIWKNIFYTKKKNIYHMSDLIKSLNKNTQSINLTNQIFLLNPCSYPYTYLKILKKISNLTKIYLFICTPFKNLKNITKKKYNYSSSFISHWYKDHFKQIKYIFTLTKNIKQKYILNKNKTLLENIQNTIKNIHIYNILKKKKFLKCDNSISIHECCSYLREIEVLYDNISYILNKNKNIEPKDIIIKTQNIENYIPFIKSVFISENQKNKIPFNIYKKKFYNSKILYILNKILELPENKFKSEKILNILNFSFISKKFLIDKKELKIIKKWVKDTNIRWGIDKNHKKKINHLPINQNTWHEGIKKIIIGYGVKNYILWNNILPYNINETKELKILEKLLFFIKTLKKWKKKLSTKKNIHSWKKIYSEIITDFFYLSSKQNKKIKYIQKKWNLILKQIKHSSYKKRISIKIIQFEMNNKLKNIFEYKKNNYNCITFTNFKNFRTIPFKITYILGMNYNEFPKKNIQTCENLLYIQKKNNNYQQNSKEYFMFLELLYFTQKKIFISYINNSIYDVKTQKYSIILNQFNIYIQQNFFFKKKNLNKKNNFLKKLLFIHPEHSFEKENFNIKNNFHSFHSIWILSKNKKKINTKKNIKIPLLYKIKKIYINNLLSFWNNPIKYFFNNRLKIFYKTERLNNYNQEPFYIDKKNHYLLNKKILDYMIFKKDTKNLFKKIFSIGILPHGNLGKTYLNYQVKKIKKIFNKIKNMNMSLKEKNIKFKIKKYIIEGKLKNITEKGLLRWKAFNLNHYNKITLWIEHLIYCIQDGQYNSSYIGMNNKITFKNIPKNLAKKYLLKYIIGYIQGLQKPIILTNTGLNWFHYIYDKKKKNLSKKNNTIIYSKKKIIETWNGNKYVLGEKKDPYIKKIYTLLNNNFIKKTCYTCKYWMLPIYKNSI